MAGRREKSLLSNHGSELRLTPLQPRLLTPTTTAIKIPTHSKLSSRSHAQELLCPSLTTPTKRRAGEVDFCLDTFRVRRLFSTYHVVLITSDNYGSLPLPPPLLASLRGLWRSYDLP